MPTESSRTQKAMRVKSSCSSVYENDATCRYPDFTIGNFARRPILGSDPNNVLNAFLGVRESEEGVKTPFANDLKPKQQALVYATQTPASHTVFDDKSGEPAGKTNQPGLS